MITILVIKVSINIFYSFDDDDDDVDDVLVNLHDLDSTKCHRSTAMKTHKQTNTIRTKLCTQFGEGWFYS